MKLNSANDLWHQCLRVIRDNVSETTFSTWFLPIVPLSYENNVFTLQVPSQFFYEYIEDHLP
jgi:chromosomal replication initiator protein